MKKVGMSLVYLALISCASWPNAKKEKAQMQAQVGMSLLESGNYPEALSALLLAHEMDPKDASILNNLGLAYFYRGRADKAKLYLQKSISQDEKLTDARNNLGRILIELGEYKKAEEHLKLATEDLTYPRPDRPYLNLGMLYFKMARYHDAKRSLEKSLRYQKNNCTATTLLGRSYYELKDYLSSASVLDRAIGYCTFQASDEAQYWSGMSYARLGDFNKAKRRFSELVKLYPESPYRIQAQKQLAEERYSQ
jgi:type IV pilus biogenesis/stability protein PilW